MIHFRIQFLRVILQSRNTFLKIQLSLIEKQGFIYWMLCSWKWSSSALKWKSYFSLSLHYFLHVTEQLPKKCQGKRCKLWKATFLIVAISVALGYLVPTTQLMLSHIKSQESKFWMVKHKWWNTNVWSFGFLQLSLLAISCIFISAGCP